MISLDTQVPFVVLSIKQPGSVTNQSEECAVKRVPAEGVNLSFAFILQRQQLNQGNKVVLTEQKLVSLLASLFQSS